MKKANTLQHLKQLVLEAIEEAGIGRDRMILNPGSPEWDELQKVLGDLNLPKRSPAPLPRKPVMPKKDEPENLPVQRSKHPVKMFSPEEMDVLRRAAEILKSKDR